MADERVFVATTYQGRVIVTRTSRKGEVFRIEMAPSEAAKATKIVGIALATVEHAALPDHIKNTPFVVRFFKRRIYALERTDLNFSLPFTAIEGDELIVAIEMGLAMCLNAQTQGKVVPCGTTSSPHMASNEPL